MRVRSLLSDFIAQRTLTDSLARSRTAASVGMAPAGSKISIDPATFMLNGKRFVGCTEGDSLPAEVRKHYQEKNVRAQLTPRQFIPQMIEMQKSGVFPIEKLCTFYSYKDIDKAVAAMHDGSVRIFCRVIAGAE
jgi:Zn-dependent alcohol dehydrogenase